MNNLNNLINNAENNDLTQSDLIQTKFNNPWFKVETVNDDAFFSADLAKVCIKNQQQKRWILCVDGDDSRVQSLAKSIDKSKLLRVNGQHQPIAFDKIARALLKGNCSTVILCDPQLSEEQLLMLQSCAKHGKTECIVVKNTPKQLH
ncbi:hypothetical protein [Thalassotalea sp. ND16A]|uniref:hypothetical protein n=1 Tax=Thalassotalea sp. ND16A TaxID=1535422 RepID=UPI00051A7AF5|nr:hypothetical protein [Thalassotalea sp. ND16A]KGJ99613.1 hypothetical protein ND16A_3713 [Thalassotalea sp. ND16A]